VILFGSTLGLIRYPGAFLAALATLVGLSLFFTFFYPGAYRHEALWLCFLIGCYWIASAKATASEPRISFRWPAVLRPVSTVGRGLFLLLMAMQVPIGVENVLAATGDGPPFSCSRDLGAFLRGMPELHDAILIAEPDALLESLRYYVSNPTYLVREQRYGSFVSPGLSRSQLTLDDVLANARRLHAATNKPVVILLAYPLDPFVSGRVYRDSRNWEFLVTPEQERVFIGATQLLESFPAAVTDEHFDVYLLK